MDAMDDLLNQKIFLAPMAGYTDPLYRGICKEFGVDVTVSELISSEAVTRGCTRTLKMCRSGLNEHPYGIQIFGSSAETMARSAGILEEKLKPDFIDLNFGCPARKIVKRGAGVALMKDSRLAGEIAAAVVKSVSVPVSAKIRTGWKRGSENAEEIARILEDSGISFLTVHGRAGDQGYGEPSSVEWIGRVRNVINLPLVGNGDIMEPEDALRMVEESGCESVMVGRGAIGNPWIFERIKHLFRTGTVTPPPSIFKKLTLGLKHFELLIEEEGERKAVLLIRKHFAWYTKGIPFGASLRKAINSSNTVPEVRSVVRKTLENFPTSVFQF